MSINREVVWIAMVDGGQDSDSSRARKLITEDIELAADSEFIASIKMVPTNLLIAEASIDNRKAIDRLYNHHRITYGPYKDMKYFIEAHVKAQKDMKNYVS